MQQIPLYLEGGECMFSEKFGRSQKNAIQNTFFDGIIRLLNLYLHVFSFSSIPNTSSGYQIFVLSSHEKLCLFWHQALAASESPLFDSFENYRHRTRTGVWVHTLNIGWNFHTN
jgi:hypothetical protein